MIKGSLTKYLLLFGLPALFLGCKKEHSQDELSSQEELQIALAAVRGDAQMSFSREEVFDNVLGVNTEFGIGGTGVFGRLQRPDSLACVTVLIQRLGPNAFPARVTLDFGGGCTGRDGRTRSGKIIIDYTARITEPGATATTTFDHYQLDSFAISGTHIVENTTPPGTGPNHNRVFRVTINNGRIDKPSGNYIRANSTRVLTQVEGAATPNFPADDVFLISGESHGTLQTNDLVSNWQSVIETPLRKSFNCRWIRQGTVRTNRGTSPSNPRWVALLDYGQGNCDNVASLTVNNSTYQISLP
ncbi:hypothetical protein [Flaviaesturariibacter terrae]